MDTGLLETSEFQRVGSPGTRKPQVHRPTTLLAALRYKHPRARTGLKVHIVTSSASIPSDLRLGQAMTEQGITLPVHVGIAGLRRRTG